MLLRFRLFWNEQDYYMPILPSASYHNLKVLILISIDTKKFKQKNLE